MLSSISLVPKDRASRHVRGVKWDTEDGDILKLVWSRERMKIRKEEFELNVETVKDLDDVWKELGGEWGAERSVLLDDEASKAVCPSPSHFFQMGS
jgi:hypothetical protein